jgi:hypothetical protein
MNHPRNTRRAVLTALLSGVGLNPKRYLFRNPQPQLLAQFVEHIVTGWLEKWSEKNDRPTYLQRLAAFQFGNELCIAIALGLEHHGQNSRPPYYNRFRESWFLSEPETLVNLHTDLVQRLVRKHAHGATAVMQGVAAQILASARGQGKPLPVVLDSLAGLFDAHIEAATAICSRIGMIDHHVRVSASR